jgi:hypothetical protein
MMLRLLKELISTDDQPEDPEITPEGMVITGRAGLLTGTLVATDQGWRPAETLCVGDRLLSFDHGLQAVAELQRERLRSLSDHPGAPLRAVEVPAGALGNDAPLWLMPDQGLLLESDKALEILGDPFAVVPARALLGVNGIRLAAPGRGVSITTLAFARDEAVYVAGGPLLYCPRPRNVMAEGLDNDMSFFSVQTLQSARYLVRSLVESRGARALCAAPEEIAGQLPEDPNAARPLAG